MDFLRMNPAGQVPVLRIDDLVLADSTAIFEYLEETYPEPPLLPKSPALRAEARRLIGLVRRQVPQRGDGEPALRAGEQEARQVRLSREREDQGRHPQHQVPPRLYRLADGPPALAGRRHADDRRLRGGGASLLPRLRRATSTGRATGGSTSGTPRSSRGRRSARSSPTWCRASPRRSTMRTSTSERAPERTLAGAAEGAGAGGGLRRLRHLRAGRDPGGGGAARGLRRGGLARADGAGWPSGWAGAGRRRRSGRRRARSIMLAEVYTPEEDPLAVLARRDRGAISVYARGRDYHDVVKTRLKRLGRWLVAETGAEIKVFVDTAPVMEKPLAQAAGLGWQGKHTNLAQPRARQLVLPRRDLHHARAAARRARRRITAGRAGPASTSARPGRSRRPTGSMRGAASAI